MTAGSLYLPLEGGEVDLPLPQRWQIGRGCSAKRAFLIHPTPARHSASKTRVNALMARRPLSTGEVKRARGDSAKNNDALMPRSAREPPAERAHRGRIVRLLHEYRVRHAARQVVAAIAARRIDHRQAGFERPGALRELRPAHAAGQIDIREQDVDRPARAEIAQRLVGARRLVHVEAELA